MDFDDSLVMDVMITCDGLLNVSKAVGVYLVQCRSIFFCQFQPLSCLCTALFKTN